MWKITTDIILFAIIGLSSLAYLMYSTQEGQDYIKHKRLNCTDFNFTTEVCKADFNMINK